MKYYLYKLECFERAQKIYATPGIAGRIVDFSPFGLRWVIPLLRAGGIELTKTIIMIVWAVLAGVAKLPEFRIFAYISIDGRILHYSVVSPTVMHLPWLKGVGVEIGGCLTVFAARGMKIYPHVLRHIACKLEYAMPIYMIVDESNVASRAGMQRAGFELTNQLRRRSGSVRPPQYERLQFD